MLKRKKIIPKVKYYNNDSKAKLYLPNVSMLTYGHGDETQYS